LLKQCAAYGRENGVIIGVQNHNDYIYTADEAIQLVNAVDSDWDGGEQIDCVLTGVSGVGTFTFSFLEDDLEIWRRWLESDLATEMLDDRQAHFRILHGEPPWQPEITQMVDYFATLPYCLSSLPHYSKMRKPLVDQVGRQLAEVSTARGMIASQQLNLNRSVYRNFYKNVATMEGVLDSGQLRGKFEGVPAIICGAGPSLERQLPLLRRLSDRALLIGCGSALTALTHHNLFPHVAGGLCPDPMEGQRFWHNEGQEVPFFFRTRIDHDALDAIHGPHLYTQGCEGAGGAALSGAGGDLGVGVAVLLRADPDAGDRGVRRARGALRGLGKIRNTVER